MVALLLRVVNLFTELPIFGKESAAGMARTSSSGELQDANTNTGHLISSAQS